MKNSFILFTEHYEYIKDLDMNQRGLLLTAIYEYENGDEIGVELDPVTKMVFKFIKTSLDVNAEKYDAIVAANKANGSKGGRPSKRKTQETQPVSDEDSEKDKNPKNPMVFSKTENNPNKANGFCENPKKHDNDSVSDSDNDSDFIEEADASLSTDVDEAEYAAPEEKRKVSSKSIANRVMEMFNAICVSYPQCTIINKDRKAAINARLNTGFTIDDFEECFRKAEVSLFLRGKNKNNWRASFDWLIADANMGKVLSGNYDNKEIDSYSPNGRDSPENGNIFEKIMNEERTKEREGLS